MTVKVKKPAGDLAPMRSSGSKTRGLQRAALLLDDVIWAIQSLKLDNLRDAAAYLHAASAETSSPELRADKKMGVNPNQGYLIGVLPTLFQDRNLFPQNEDIIAFSRSALGIEMNPSSNRSRYEIIGRVVCETAQLKDAALTELVAALADLTSSKQKMAEIAKKRETSGFSWNMAIQEMFKRS